MDRCNPDALERVADGRGAALWILTTAHSLKSVLRKGYFATVAEHGLRRHDRIWVNASGADDEPEYATLVVAAADPARAGDIAVKRLPERSNGS